MDFLGSGFQGSVYGTQENTAIKRFKVHSTTKIRGVITTIDKTPSIVLECEQAKFAGDVLIGPTVYGYKKVTKLNKKNEEIEYIELEMDKINVVDDWSDISRTEFNNIFILFKKMIHYGFLVVDGKLGYYNNNRKDWRMIDYGVVETYNNPENDLEKMRYSLIMEYLDVQDHSKLLKWLKKKLENYFDYLIDRLQF